MTILFIGIDLAKNVFALHGVDEHGKPALVRPAVRRDQLLELVFTERKKKHALMLEALDLLFKNRGLKSIKQLTGK